jgi:hypothetical protein
VNDVVYIEIQLEVCNNETMTDEEFERRKQEYGPREQAIVTATAKVFYSGNERAAWQAVFEVAERDRHFSAAPLTISTATRLHLKATHQ